MKLTAWLLGVLQILLGVMLSAGHAPAWGWVWVGAVVVWLFVGCGLLLTWLLHLVKDRVGEVKLPVPVAAKGVHLTPREDK